MDPGERHILLYSPFQIGEAIMTDQYWPSSPLSRTPKPSTAEEPAACPPSPRSPSCRWGSRCRNHRFWYDNTFQPGSSWNTRGLDSRRSSSQKQPSIRLSPDPSQLSHLPGPSLRPHASSSPLSCSKQSAQIWRQPAPAQQQIAMNTKPIVSRGWSRANHIKVETKQTANKHPE